VVVPEMRETRHRHGELKAHIGRWHSDQSGEAPADGGLPS
jgi:hypothetical protein